MSTARAMSDLYEANARLTSKYVHACSRGHEAIQWAAGRLLGEQDYVSAYYRDDCLLLALGMEPEELMLQLLAKADDPFSGGRTYYSHPSLNQPGLPRIPHQSSATGMQAIPAAGVAMGVQYREVRGLGHDREGEAPVVICSIGDAAMTEGEVSEALHMSDLKELPIIWLVQDNEWDISAHASEIRSHDVSTLIKAFPQIKAFEIDGADTEASMETMQSAFDHVRKHRKPVMVHAHVPLLGHHTSGVRKEWYRDDLEAHEKRDPIPRLRKRLVALGIDEEELNRIQREATEKIQKQFDEALLKPEPTPENLLAHTLAPTLIKEEEGQRIGDDDEPTLMVDCALHAMQEILAEHPEALLYGQDVGGRLGGVFREAATLAQKFGDDRVFNTPIQEAFIIGSTAGMSAAGLRPIVEVQFADYLWPGLNQLFTELSRSYFLSNGQWPIHSVIRVPIGAYGSGGPYHSSSIESVLANIRGIKVVYPSNGADLKGLLKSAYYDPNPVVVLEHKGLYWSKIPGTEDAKVIEPDAAYRVPIGKARLAHASTAAGESKCTVITYGRGVYWAKEAIEGLEEHVEILDLRSISPVDFDMVSERINRSHRALIVTEEPVLNGFAQALAGRISTELFAALDAPVQVVGSMETPAIPLNEALERFVLVNANKVRDALDETLAF
ncbi:MAG: tungsten formylmethanofuran dehydrogenase [Flavobacteriales bacterium]|nr:tungsten formylmethanofuran dehydrogenase [Flavobacteriales bacterium]